MQKARIKLSSTNVEKLNEICNSIRDIAEKTKVNMKGPIPIPTDRLTLTVRKSPDGEGKASYDNFEMRIHKRLIDLGLNERALRLIMRIPIPDGVNISIEIVE